MKRGAPWLLLCAACSDPIASAASVVDASSADASPLLVDAARPPDAEAGPNACTLVRKYSTRNAPCNACAEARCCDVINACFDDPSCDDGYVNCAIACAIDYDGGGPDAAPDAGPTSCLAECARAYPGGSQKYEAAIGCADRACVAECL